MFGPALGVNHHLGSSRCFRALWSVAKFVSIVPQCVLTATLDSDRGSRKVGADHRGHRPPAVKWPPPNRCRQDSCIRSAARHRVVHSRKVDRLEAALPRPHSFGGAFGRPRQEAGWRRSTTQGCIGTGTRSGQVPASRRACRFAVGRANEEADCLLTSVRTC